MIYQDDPSIKFYVIEDDNALHPFQGARKQMLEEQGYAVYTCGYLSAKPRIYEFPFCFYDDLNIPRETMIQYFYVPNFIESLQLYVDVASINPNYRIIHQQSSNKRLPIWEKISTKYPNDLLLDINENHYEEEHPYYAIAQKVINKPLLHYKLLIEKAKGIYVLESSFYCLATHLDLHEVDEKICYESFDKSNERLGVFATGTL